MMPPSPHRAGEISLMTTAILFVGAPITLCTVLVSSSINSLHFSSVWLGHVVTVMKGMRNFLSVRCHELVKCGRRQLQLCMNIAAEAEQANRAAVVGLVTHPQDDEVDDPIRAWRSLRGKGLGILARYVAFPFSSAINTFGTPSGPGLLGPSGSRSCSRNDITV